MNSWSVQCRYRPGFRPGDILAFHRRDTQKLPGASSARRAKACNGEVYRACPDLSSFRLKSRRLAYWPSTVKFLPLAQFEAMLRHMLGLSQDVATSNNMQTIRSASCSPSQADYWCRAASPLSAKPGPSAGQQIRSPWQFHFWLLVPQAFAIGGLLLPTAPQVPH
jgi:hypothetical protein